jgi:hypothetical protein
LSHGVFRLWCFCFPEGYAFFYLLRCTPELVITQEKKAAGVSPQAHEKAWDKELIVRGELDALRQGLAQYAEALGAIAGVNE